MADGHSQLFVDKLLPLECFDDKLLGHDGRKLGMNLKQDPERFQAGLRFGPLVGVDNGWPHDVTEDFFVVQGQGKLHYQVVSQLDEVAALPGSLHHLVQDCRQFGTCGGGLENFQL